MSRHRITTALAVMLFAAPLAAQGESQVATAPESLTVTTTAVAPTAPVAQAGPTITNAVAGIQTSASTISAPTMAPRREGSVGRNPAMMIVGGVALITGAIIGGDTGTIVMIGGGALGLYGLWQYLK